MWTNVANIPSFVPKAASVPAGSRNRQTSVPAGSRNRQTSVPAGSRNRTTSVPAGSRNRPTSVPAGRPFSAGWKNTTARPMTRPTSHYFQHFRRSGYYNQLNMDEGRWGTAENPHKNRDLGIVDSGCSRSMTGNKEKLDDFVKIVGEWFIVEELHNFNLFSVSQICDTKNKVLFTDKECLVLSKEFQLPENSQVVLRSWGFPSKLFTNDHNCVACNKGKQHKASYKAITAVSTISEPLQLLHMDLFMFPTSSEGIDHKYYFPGGLLMILAEFKNSKLIELCGSKGIKRDYSNARTPQQNGVAERKNRTLIEAARTMLADSKLPTMFWTEAVSTACYVLNRVLVTRPHNKTPYELLSGKVPNTSHLKPFGCHVTILNTSDHLGKFKGKADEGFIVGYATHSKAYRVYNLSSKKIEETLHLRFLEDKPNVQGLGQEWHFDLDYLTDSLVIVVPSSSSNPTFQVSIWFMKLLKWWRVIQTYDKKGRIATASKQEHEDQRYSLRIGNIDLIASITAGSIDPTASISTGTHEPFPTVIEPVHADETSLPPGHSLGSSEHSTRFPSPSDLANSISSSLEMEDIYHHPRTGIFSSSSYDADFGGTVTNLAPIVAVDPVPTKRVNTIHPQSQILGDLTSPVQTRGTLKKSKFGESTFVSYVHDQQRNNHTDYLHCLFACFLSQLEPSSVAQALNDPDWVEAMQEEMQQFINQKVWKLVPLPDGKIAIGTKWILKNKRDARGSLMYLTASRPDIQFAVSACSRHECKKQTIVDTSSTGSPEYVAVLTVCVYVSYYASQLQLDDDGGVEDLPIADIYLGMDNLGYPTEGKLTFYKNKFSPQWRFLVHTILHCLSTKSGSWDQFGSPLAIALICLMRARIGYNWSSYYFQRCYSAAASAVPTGVHHEADYSPPLRRKSLGARKKSSTELDLTADDRSFIRVLIDDSDDSNDDDDPLIFWPAFAAWEVERFCFKLHGMVVQYYEEHPLAGSGMILWGDLQVMFESHEGWVYDQNDLILALRFAFKTIESLQRTDVSQLPMSWKFSMDLTLSGPRLDADFLVADSKFMKVAFGVNFKVIAVPSSGVFNERSI
ncbi:putative ribonuclease H-like domain-containing protein [Tanacetum coccineum]